MTTTTMEEWPGNLLQLKHLKLIFIRFSESFAACDDFFISLCCFAIAIKLMNRKLIFLLFDSHESEKTEIDT